MGHARSFFVVTALLTLGCVTARPPETSASFDRCLIADTTAATPDTVHAIVEVARQSTLDCDRRSLAPSNAPVVIAVTPPSGVDVRDILEGRGAATKRPDVVVTYDPQLIDLARRSAGYLVEPLLWNTTWVLATRRPDSTAMPDVAERDALARDVVAGDARGAVEPFPWLTDASCAQQLVSARTTASAVVAYSSGDPIARAIAERVASLSSLRAVPVWLSSALLQAGARMRVAPVARDSIAGALVSGRAAVAVYAIARDPSTPCGTRENGTVARGAIPLVDARPHVIVRRGSGAAFIVGSDGALHFVKRGTR